MVVCSSQTTYAVHSAIYMLFRALSYIFDVSAASGSIQHVTAHSVYLRSSIKLALSTFVPEMTKIQNYYYLNIIIQIQLRYLDFFKVHNNGVYANMYINSISDK